MYRRNRTEDLLHRSLIHYRSASETTRRIDSNQAMYMKLLQRYASKKVFKKKNTE